MYTSPLWDASPRGGHASCPVSQCYWRLDSIKEAGHYWTADGRLLQCTPSLTLTEYDDSNYVEEKSIVNKYGKAYNIASAVFGGL